MMRRLLACMPMLVALLAPGAAFPASNWQDARWVSKEELVSAMRRQQSLGYAIEAIANAPRLQAGVFLDLAGRQAQGDPPSRPLRIGHQEYFDALLEVTGLTPESAPTYVRAAHEFREDYLIDGRVENVIERIERGERPERALNVKVGWPPSPDAPTSYSYEDRSTRPHVEVTHKQVSAHRVLVFGDVIVFDQIRGVTGRATSGVLGAIFSLLGKAKAVQTRFAFAADGAQVSLTTAKKLFTVTQPVTIYPDGTVRAGVPPQRRDLIQLLEAVKELDFDIVYVPFDMGPVP
jgi:hypothetical protein